MPALASLSQEDLDALAAEQAAQDYASPPPEPAPAPAAAPAPAPAPEAAPVPPPYDPAQDTQGMQAQPNYIAPAPAPTASPDASAQQTVYDPALQSNVPAPAAEPAPAYVDTGVAPPESTQQTIAPAPEPTQQPVAPDATNGELYPPPAVEAAPVAAPPLSSRWWTGVPTEDTAAVDMERRRAAADAQGHVGLGEASIYPRLIPAFAQLSDPFQESYNYRLQQEQERQRRAGEGQPPPYTSPSTDTYQPTVAVPSRNLGPLAGTMWDPSLQNQGITTQDIAGVSPGTILPGLRPENSYESRLAQDRWGTGEMAFLPGLPETGGAAADLIAPRRGVVEPPPAGAIDVPYRVAPEAPAASPAEIARIQDRFSLARENEAAAEYARARQAAAAADPFQGRTVFSEAPLATQDSRFSFRPGQTTPEMSARAPEQAITAEAFPAPAETPPPVRTVARPPEGNVVAGGPEATGAPVTVEITPEEAYRRFQEGSLRYDIGTEDEKYALERMADRLADQGNYTEAARVQDGVRVDDNGTRYYPDGRVETREARAAAAKPSRGQPSAAVGEAQGAPVRAVTPSEAAAPFPAPDELPASGNIVVGGESAGPSVRTPTVAGYELAAVQRAAADARPQTGNPILPSQHAAGLATRAKTYPVPAGEVIYDARTGKPYIPANEITPIKPAGPVPGAGPRTVTPSGAVRAPMPSEARPPVGQDVVPSGEVAGAPVSPKEENVVRLPDGTVLTYENGITRVDKPDGSFHFIDDTGKRVGRESAPPSAPQAEAEPVPPPPEEPVGKTEAEPPPSAPRKSAGLPRVLGGGMKPGLARKAVIGGVGLGAVSAIMKANQEFGSGKAPSGPPTTGTTKAPTAKDTTKGFPIPTSQVTSETQSQAMLDDGAPATGSWTTIGGVRVWVSKGPGGVTTWGLEPAPGQWETAPDSAADLQARIAEIAAKGPIGNPWITAKQNLAPAPTPDEAESPTAAETDVDAITAGDYEPPPEEGNIVPGAVGQPTPEGGVTTSPAVTPEGDVPLYAADGTDTGMVITKDGEVKQSSGGYSSGGYSGGGSYGGKSYGSGGSSYRSGGSSYSGGGSSYSRKKKKKKSTSSPSFGGSSQFWEGFPFNRPPSPIRQQILDAIAASKAKGSAKKKGS